MTMTPSIRKFALTVHIAVSVGWLGAVLTYLALAIVIRTSPDSQMVRASYLVLDPITWYVLLPLAIASLLTGLVMSLGTPWGLLKHYWILFKLMLTVFATVILLVFTKTLSGMVEAAGDQTTSLADLRAMGAGMGHAVGALVVLLIILGLSVYMPQGLTRYGWRKQQEKRNKPRKRTNN